MYLQSGELKSGLLALKPQLHVLFLVLEELFLKALLTIPQYLKGLRRARRLHGVGGSDITVGGQGKKREEVLMVVGGIL